MRPVGHHLCRFESLVDGTLDLEAVATMNEYLDVQAINMERLRPKK